MKKFLVIITLVISSVSFAGDSAACNPGNEVLEKAALALALINNPEGEITVKVGESKNPNTFVVIVDDNYGLSETVITTKKDRKFCRITSIAE